MCFGVQPDREVQSTVPGPENTEVFFFFFNSQIRDREKRFVTRFLITKMDLQMLKCQKNNEQIFEQMSEQDYILPFYYEGKLFLRHYIF